MWLFRKSKEHCHLGRSFNDSAVLLLAPAAFLGSDLPTSTNDHLRLTDIQVHMWLALAEQESHKQQRSVPAWATELPPREEPHKPRCWLWQAMGAASLEDHLSHRPRVETHQPFPESGSHLLAQRDLTPVRDAQRIHRVRGLHELRYSSTALWQERDTGDHQPAHQEKEHPSALPPA